MIAQYAKFTVKHCDQVLPSLYAAAKVQAIKVRLHTPLTGLVCNTSSNGPLLPVSRQGQLARTANSLNYKIPARKAPRDSY